MDTQHPAMMSYLEQIPDPRKDQGKVYEWRFLLALIAAALASGCKSVRSIARWAAAHAMEIVTELRMELTRIPSISTFYRVLCTINLPELERQVAQHNQALDADDPASGRITGPNGEVRYGQSLDGKEIRGARAHGRRICLVSLVRHESGIVLGQESVAHRSNEIPTAQSLLAGRDLRGTVTTVDALLTQRSLAQQILDQGGDYLMVVKGNQPELLEHLELLFRVPPEPAEEGEFLTYTSTDKGHGRIEIRTLESSTALNDYLDWPGVGQVMRRTCRRIIVKSGEVTEETTYGITSLNREQALPKQLETLWRGHWTIENRNHYVRDATMGEDRGQVRTGSAPQALAALRNGILSLLRYHGWSNIAEALDYYRDHVQKALRLIGASAT